MSEFISLSRMEKAFPKILSSISVTLEIVVVAILLGLFLGMMIALVKIFKIPILNQVLSVYISFMRGTPIIIQLYVVYYGLPIMVSNLFHIDINGWNKMFFVITAYTLNEAAFLSEIIRGAIQAIPKEQFEAGYSIGMTYAQTFVHVILPQTIRVAIPSFGVDLVSLFQSTSLAYLLGVLDMIGRAKVVGVNSGHVLDGYIDAAIIFVFISILIEYIFQKIQKKGDIIYGNC